MEVIREQPAALACEVAELERGRLLLRLQAHDSIAGERDAQQEALADAATAAQDDEGRRCGSIRPQLLDLALAVDDA